jgi:peroxiredoxin
MRQSFLVNKDGVIVWRDLNVSPKDQVANVLKALK